MRQKNAVFICNKKDGKSGSVAPKRKVAEKLHRFDCHRTKIRPNPNIPAYSKSPWQGANMHFIVYVSNMPWKKVPAFLKSHPWYQKPENNRFCVPIHVATKDFAFEKFPPPPSLLHPPKDWKIAFQTPRTSRLSTFYYCQVVNRSLLRLLSTCILV